MFALSRQLVIAYDNYNFLDRKRDQNLGSSHAEMVNLTTSILVCNPHLPVGGLQQSMLDLSKELGLRPVAVAAGNRYNHELNKVIAKHFIAQAITELHGEDLSQSAMKYIEEHYPLKVDRLDAVKTEICSPGGSFYNEGTLNGTQRVHEDIILNKLSYGVPKKTSSTTEMPDANATVATACGPTVEATQEDDTEDYLDTAEEFTQRLLLIFGDSLTAKLVRSVKVLNAYAARAFERRRWMVTPCGWFHTRLNLLLQMVRTHWRPVAPKGEDASKLQSKHTLSFDQNFFDHSGVNKDGGAYHNLEPLVMKGWKARVTALFYQQISTMDKFRGSCFQPNDRSIAVQRRKEYCKIMGKLTNEEFDYCVNAVYEAAFTKNAWVGSEDHEFTTMCRYLQQGLLFMALRSAERMGDVGLLDFLIDPLAVAFLGAGQQNYVVEMLYMRWLIKISHPELKHAILAASLVNPTGEKGKFKAIDLEVEHHNHYLSLDQKARKNSTHDSLKTFSQQSLILSESKKIREAFEIYFARSRTSTAHSYKKVADDIFSLAVFLFLEGCGIDRPHLDRRTAKTTWLSKDIKTCGQQRLPAKVAEFNSSVVQKVDRFQHLMGGTTDGGNEDGITRPEAVGFDENVEIEQLILAEDQPLNDVVDD